MTSRWLRRLGWIFLVLLLAALVALIVWEPFTARSYGPPKPSALGREYRAEILRDKFGVPHIYGETDADVAYGVAVAHAEDDFFTLQDVIAMTRGRYGAIAGEEGAQIDFAYHLLDARGTADRHYGSVPADTRALFEAYAAGLNRYAAEHPSELKLANLFPVNGKDVATGFALRQPFFFGLNNVIGPLVAGEQLRPEYGPRTAPVSADPGTPIGAAARERFAVHPGEEIASAQSRSPLALPLPMGEDGALSGSNAFAIAPEKSGDGVTRLVSNAHQPWRGGVSWYELVVESGEGWHFAGANFPGSPFPFLGHNENLGWTNTVNRPDMVDVYKLILNNNGTKYRVDGEWLPLVEDSFVLPVRFGPFVIPISRTVYRSIHGPVIKNDRGAFGIRYGGMDQLGQLDAYYRLNKAADLEEWESIIARMDIPSTNFIYGDADGNIAYIYNAAIPDRLKGADWRGILPGDDSALIWDGPVDYAAIPKYVNPASGWLFNANNTPFSAAGPGSDLDPSSVPPEMGVELKSTNRARRAARLMAAARIIDRATLEAIKYDTAYDREGYVARMLDEIAALELTRDPALREAQRLLGTWDLGADNVGRADALALLVLRDFMSAEYQNGKWPDARTELAEAADHLRRHFGRLDPPMSQLLRLRQGDVDLPLDGGSDTLRASTSWDVHEDGRLSVRHGDSFVMFMEWPASGPVRSQSIQPFGSATTRPGNVHYNDQSTLFVQHRLKPVHFWRRDALANAASRKVVTGQ